MPGLAYRKPSVVVSYFAVAQIMKVKVILKGHICCQARPEGDFGDPQTRDTSTPHLIEKTSPLAIGLGAKQATLRKTKEQRETFAHPWLG